ncbi:MAG: hypothetical protein BAJALOKI3v1_200016 [Promethearchaeota archaeon]|nr:MAG: hypothetical protein BAJALOKI3v1_200016 [Candidatus Lokiarchaeota archaeon]
MAACSMSIILDAETTELGSEREVGRIVSMKFVRKVMGKS